METASNGHDDDDLGLVLIPEGFFEAGRVNAADVTTEGLLTPTGPVETASSGHDDDDLGLVLTPEDFSEAGRVIAPYFFGCDNQLKIVRTCRL